MQFLKLCCWKDALRADIELGGIKKRNNGEPQLVLNVSITYGSIRSNTDFLYLQPQKDPNQARQELKSITNTSTASSQVPRFHDNLGLRDRDNIPKRLKDVKQERVILIEKDTNLCDNIGHGYIDLQTQKGNYKVYYLRIENEQRILSNSRLEVIGESVMFTLDQLNSESDKSRDKLREQSSSEQQKSYEESYSYTNQDSYNLVKRQLQGSPNSYAESSLDSAVLMRQIQSNPVANSYSQSMLSSDQTKLIGQNSQYDGDSGSISYQHQSNQYDNQQSSNSQFYSEGNSRQSQNQSQSIIVKKDADDSLLYSKSNQSKSKHRRGQNMQFVLEDLSNQNIARRINQKQQNQGQGSNLSIRKRIAPSGKENLTEIRPKRGGENMDQKPYSLTAASLMKKKNLFGGPSRNFQNMLTEEDDLDVRYVDNIDSIAPLQYYPQTKTYFKCSIYSPSNRLFTVNEEVNSTQSDLGDFTQSHIVNGLRVSGLLFSQKKAQQVSDRIIDENQKIEEEENDDEDPGNLSEGMILPQTPTPKIIQQMKNHNLNDEISAKISNGISGTHTRTSSTKAQSLRGSIHLQKPLGSHFSSITSLHPPITNNSIKNIEKIDKQLLNKFLRETFSGVLPQESGIQRFKREKNGDSIDDLNDDVQKYIQPMPSSFVVQGESDFLLKGQTFGQQKQSDPVISYGGPEASIKQRKKSIESIGKLSRGSQKKKNLLSVEKTLIKIPQAVGSRKSSNHVSSNGSVNDKSEQSPETYYDEENRKVFIIQNNFEQGQQVQHCIKWEENTDLKLVGRAIDDVITKVKKLASPQKLQL
ncbi:UNKNOWN [Stylonychia lemnae]|uniref:Uncharacterized protein n=1 Tax=Stylonychia lemnae TaxID=5949 RepID=A0A078A7U4_STYLE|nr:UNKNOWN [Stylonychia lemnae]|eukprot:CDW78330.1 UNKNOWN [Stylonychia lemnae]